MNVANAAKENGIKHMVFSGLKSAKELIGKDGCEHFDSKKRMHDYIMKQGLCCFSAGLVAVNISNGVNVGSETVSLK